MATDRGVPSGNEVSSSAAQPLGFDPHRFQNAAAHYWSGRPPYAPQLVLEVAHVIGLSSADRVLDLGCGPGQLAIGFAFFCGRVVAMDPEPEMLAIAGQFAAGLAPNIAFVRGSSYDLSAAIGSFRLVTMGRSFHWMDRPAVLATIDKLVDAPGGVALFGDAHPDVPAKLPR